MKTEKPKFLVICVILGLTTLSVFWQVRHFDFINFDDHTYVTKNAPVLAGLNRNSVIWAFTTIHSSNWHPLTWLSHMLDCQSFGPGPGWHHLTNVFFHIANTLLLFTVLKKMTGTFWQSAFVAAAFALHPLHVESVAWISERKDVLSTFFWILTMLCYVRYVEHPGMLRYLLALFVFVLGLMAKPMLVTLPCVLLLLDYWPLEHFGKKSFHHLIFEKIPFFILSAASSTATFLIQKETGATNTLSEIPLWDHISNVVVSYGIYIWKMLWPTHLAIFYPYPQGKLPYTQIIIAAMLLLTITIFVIYFSSRYKYLVTGWLWFIGTLIPVIGLVKVGMQDYADRYTYVPLIGLFIAIAFGVYDVFSRWEYGKAVLAALSATILIIWMVCTSIQLGYWKNNVTLFQHTLKVTKNNYLAHNVLAYSFYIQGNFDKSIAQNYEALKIKPDYAVIHNGLGLAMFKKGEINQAAAFFRQAIQLRPDFADAHFNLGLVLSQQGRHKDAAEELTTAIALNPQSDEIRAQLAHCLLATGKVREAVLQLKAAAQFSNDWTTFNNLAWHLAIYEEAEFYDPIEAVRFAQTACQLAKNQNPVALDTLAITYAAIGKFDEAINAAQKALKLAQAANNKQMADSIQQHLTLFRNHQPYVEDLPK